MRTPLVLALLSVLATVACAPGSEDLDAADSELNEVLTTLEMPIDLRPGEVHAMSFRSGAAFRVRLSQADVPANVRAAAELRVTGLNIDRSDVNLEPSVEHRPTTNETRKYSLVIKNRDGQRRLRGDLIIEPATGTDAGTGTGSPQRVSIPIEGSIQGDLSSSQSSASDSLRQQCDAWVARSKELAGADRIETTECGAPVNIDTFGRFQLASKPKATIVRQINGGQASVLTLTPWAVHGDLSSSSFSAYTSWNDRCTASLKELKAAYGDRFLAGTCDAPKNVDTFGRTELEGTARIFVSALPGKRFNDKTFVQGDLSSSSSSAMQSWLDQCRASITRLRGLVASGSLEQFTCGTPKNIDTFGRFSFTSEPDFAIVAETNGAEGIRTDATTIDGDLSSSGFSAFKSWSDKCGAMLTAAKGRHGARFIYASCGVPKNVDTFGRTQYRSEMSVLVKPL